MDAFPTLDASPTTGTGARIAFESNRDNTDDIYVIDVVGLNVTRLTVHPAEDSRPAWSPNGARIAFDSLRDGNFEIYVIDSTGLNVTRLTNSPRIDRRPTWSPMP